MLFTCVEDEGGGGGRGGEEVLGVEVGVGGKRKMVLGED